MKKIPYKWVRPGFDEVKPPTKCQCWLNVGWCFCTYDFGNQQKLKDELSKSERD